MKKSFSLLEISIVTIIVGVIATVGLINFQKTRQRVILNEARGKLEVIYNANKVMQAEENTSTGVRCGYGPRPSCSDVLGVDANPPNGWQYLCTTTYCRVRKTTAPYAGCRYDYFFNGNAPVQNGNCP
ncbi:MAG: type II secretion system protein [Candidatus Omnitrophica bacterium]|nr:type II secretion system protein [Candidatus Omnitrophota bacterium]